MTSTIGIVFDDVFYDHDTGARHPECPERLSAVREAIETVPHVPIAPRPATIDEVTAVHDADYVERLRTAIATGVTQLDPDTAASSRSFDIALEAAGSGLALYEALQAGKIQHGFAAVRPPGHHATRNRAMGFCLLNNIAILARYLTTHGVRTGVFDWDVHHGNGTIDIFESDSSVPVWNLRQEGLWPVAGRLPPLPDHIVDVALPAGSGNEEYLEAFEGRILPAIRAHDPEILLISAGFDAHEKDPLANQCLTEDAYRVMTEQLRSRPILSMLEGGYDFDGLRLSIEAHLSALSADPLS